MKSYLLTSKLTFSRAVVIASSPEDAVRHHPAERGIVYRPGVSSETDWAVWVNGGFPPAPVAMTPHQGDGTCPPHIADVEVMCLGNARHDVAPGVWCFEASDEPREP